MRLKRGSWKTDAQNPVSQLKSGLSLIGACTLFNVHVQYSQEKIQNSNI